MWGAVMSAGKFTCFVNPNASNLEVRKAEFRSQASRDENALLMPGMEDYYFRQVWPVTNLRLKIKGQAREDEIRENLSRTCEVYEKAAG